MQQSRVLNIKLVYLSAAGGSTRLLPTNVILNMVQLLALPWALHVAMSHL